MLRRNKPKAVKYDGTITKESFNETMQTLFSKKYYPTVKLVSPTQIRNEGIMQKP